MLHSSPHGWVYGMSGKIATFHNKLLPCAWKGWLFSRTVCSTDAALEPPWMGLRRVRETATFHNKLLLCAWKGWLFSRTVCSTDAALEPPWMGLRRVRETATFHNKLLPCAWKGWLFSRTVCSTDAALEPPGMGLWRVRENSYPFHAPGIIVSLVSVLSLKRQEFMGQNATPAVSGTGSTGDNARA